MAGSMSKSLNLSYRRLSIENEHKTQEVVFNYVLLPLVLLAEFYLLTIFFCSLFNLI